MVEIHKTKKNPHLRGKYKIIKNTIDNFITTYESQLFQFYNTKDYKINMHKIDEYIQTCNHPFFKFIKLAAEKSTYIDKNTFIHKYAENANEIKQIIHDKEYVGAILLLNTETVDKSNFIFTLYMYTLLKHIDVNVEFILLNKWKKNNTYPLSLTKYLLVLCDDVSYSGDQLISSITLDIRIQKNISNANLYISIVAISERAYNKIQNLIYDKSGGFTQYTLFFPSNRIKIDYTVQKLIRELITNKNLQDYVFNGEYDSYKKLAENSNEYKNLTNVSNIDEIMMFDMIILHRKHNELEYSLYKLFAERSVLYTTFTYIFYKYPDWISTFYYLCGYHYSDNLYDYRTVLTNINNNTETINPVRCKFDLDIIECDEDNISDKKQQITLSNYCNFCIHPFYKKKEFLKTCKQLVKELYTPYEVKGEKYTKILSPQRTKTLRRNIMSNIITAQHK